MWEETMEMIAPVADKEGLAFLTLIQIKLRNTYTTLEVWTYFFIKQDVET